MKLEELFKPFSDGNAAQLADTLGTLAPFWMTDKARISCAAAERSEFSEPKLDAEKGSCWVLSVMNKKLYDFEQSQCPTELMIRRAVILPLVWTVEESNHDPNLPESFRQLANKVVERVGQERGYADRLAGQKWTLWIYPKGKSPDLRGLDCYGADSGFVPIAVGLMTIIGDGRPDPSIMSTGCLNDESLAGTIRPCISSIDNETLALKFELAKRLQCKELHVPEINYIQFNRSVDANSETKLQRIDCVTTDLSLALRSLRIRSLAKPLDNDPFDQKVEFYLTRYDQKQRSEYYRHALLPECAIRCQSQIAHHFGMDRNTSHYVTFISRSYDLVFLGMEAFAPEKTLLLYTPDDSEIRNNAEIIEERFSDRKGNGTLIVSPIASDSRMLTANNDRVGSWLSQTTEGINVFDVTSGQVGMTLGLIESAPVGSLIANIRCETDSVTNRPCPGTEQILFWKTGMEGIRHLRRDDISR